MNGRLNGLPPLQFTCTDQAEIDVFCSDYHEKETTLSQCVMFSRFALFFLFFFNYFSILHLLVRILREFYEFSGKLEN